jgi:ATP-dependent Lon protease
MPHDPPSPADSEHFPPEVGAALREAAARRTETAAAASGPFPEALPLVAMQNGLFFPRALGPVHVGRPSSRAAIEAALLRAPPTLGLFAQRSEDQEDVASAADLHPVGCETFVHARIDDGGSHAWVVLEALRWIALESVEAGPGGAYRIARVAPVHLDAGDYLEVDALTDSLRKRARAIVGGSPETARLVAQIDAADPERLADLIASNLAASVDERAAYASERRLEERLRIANALAARRQGT